ncbi:MAG TPA: phosphate ABC transporter substrate-binding protein PstS [Solirubrobacteraceae bacterium]|nr:phosphate ABC transporter substrate-binding protein PstS [Solirubrobacteraceae bacterium]
MRTDRLGGIAVSLAAALAIAACGSSNSSSSSGSAGGGGGSTGTSAGASTGSGGGSVSGGTLNGAGSTLAQPIYQQWGSNLKSKGLTVNFNGVGSGAGIADLQTATVDFAGSDPSLAAEDKKGMKGPVLQFPVAFGAITVSYNLPGIKSGLKLDGPTLADIFSGKIKTWSDPAIKKLNPGMNLPSTNITIVHRSDSSGTTAGFTTYLSDVSPTWKSSIGTDKDVKWPVGTGAAKNSGVAAAVKQTQGAVGYVEQAYALENGFTYAAIKNGSSYVLPTIQNTSAAANGITVPADLGISTINSTGAGSYPIVSQTFLDVYKDPCKDGKESASAAKALKSFLSYAFGAGQQTLGSGGNKLPYAPLPSSLAAKDNTQLGTMTCNGSPIS